MSSAMTYAHKDECLIITNAILALRQVLQIELHRTGTARQQIHNLMRSEGGRERDDYGHNAMRW